MSRPRSTLAAALALTLALVTTAPAFAHALLRHANPAVGSTVAHAPPVLSLTYSEFVEPAFCRVTVSNAAGMSEAAGPLHADQQDARRLLLPLKPLPAGVYTVTWHATSTDTHRTQGRFRFTVAP